MNILVILRAVRDPAGFTVNRRAQKIFVNREQHIINPADKNALEAALALAGDGVMAVALGGAAAEDALREARAMGAGRALRVCDSTLEHVGGPDVGVVTAALERLEGYLGGVDLILLGAEVLDADLAQVGPRLAAALGWPFVEGAHKLELAQGGQPAVAAVVARPGCFRRLEAGLPAVVSIARDSNKPRYAPAANVIAAYMSADAVETLTAADLRLTSAEMTPLTEVRGQSFPPERELGSRLEGSLDDLGAQLAHALRHTRNTVASNQ